jgi:CheY-like chemotaxis protein
MAEGLKVLIAEDEAITAMMLSSRLRKLGYDVCRTASSAEEAVLRADRELPAVLLMDVRLSGRTDGIEAARVIRTRHPVPVIFMSGYTDNDQDRRVRDIGPLACLDKPLDMRELEALLEGLAAARTGGAS